MNTARPISRKNQLDCLKRELARRQRVYPKAVREKRINPHVAEYETRAMEAAIDSLDMLVQLEEVSIEMREEKAKQISSGTCPARTEIGE
jgi:hypothetical protein